MKGEKMKKILFVLMMVVMLAVLFIGCESTNTAPIITGISSTSATVATAYTATVSATDADGDTLTYTVAGPNGMVISSTGLISGWTPTASGSQAITVTASDGTESVTQSFTITVAAATEPVVEQNIIIEVEEEYLVAATGVTYVKGGDRDITVTFPAAIEDTPRVKVGTVDVPMSSPDDIVWTGTHDFTGDCDAFLITVSGVCGDSCASKSVSVDSGNPYAELKATVSDSTCDCDTGYALTITSDWSDTTDCGSVPGCCGDDLASWNVKIYDEYPWEDCCAEDPCVPAIDEADGTACPLILTTDCIDEVFVPDECGVGGYWVDFFDSNYWVIATLTDKVGNVIKYYGEVVNLSEPDGCLGGELVSFVELVVDPTALYCTCDAEDRDAADLVIGDCDGTPATECYEVPLEPCPVVTVAPTEPVEGQPAKVTIDYTLAVKPVGKVHAYVGPGFKGLPDSVLENELQLVVTADPYIYEANVVFSEVGDRIIYVVDGCDDCPECTYNMTVLPADVCPVVEFLDAPYSLGGLDTYGLSDNIDFTVTFANPIEKELVKVYVGIPGLAPIAMPIVMPLTTLQVAMTTDAEEQVYNGTIAIGEFKDVVVDAINHFIDPLAVDPDQPLEALAELSPEVVWAIHKLGCIPMTIYVLAGEPCCIQVCEYPFILDPIGPFANLEVSITPCCNGCETPCCDSIEYPGHEVTISVEDPGLGCPEEDCCGDTCSGVASWEVAVCPCYGAFSDNTDMPQGPFDECCDFDECVDPDCFGPMFESGTGCPVFFESGCLYDWADPLGLHPAIEDMAISDVWTSTWYMYVKMTDNAGNTTEYKAKMGFNVETSDVVVCDNDTGDFWTITIGGIQPLCDDDYDEEFGADFCVGPTF